jgi:TRAP-type C4-dicarboxylate transport system permease small subunit
MKKLLDGCERLMLYVSAFATFALMVLTTADAGGRYIFNHPITGAYEVTTNYLMIGAVFLGMVFGYQKGAFIRVTLLTAHLPRNVLLALNQFIQGLSILYGLALVVASFLQALRTIETGTTLSTVEIPLGPAYVIVPVGLFFMSLAMLLDMRKVRKGKSPLFQEDSPTA